MEFFSPVFFGFIVVVLIVYYFVRSKDQKYVILLSSSLFIGLLSISVLLFTFLFIIVNYIVARLIERYNQRPKLKWFFYNSGILINIGSLIFFKYINWVFESINQALYLINLPSKIPTLSIILPIGISYYTFQGISYLLQIYRGNESLEKNIVIFSNYFLFFPKFLAGPIELSRMLIPQLKKIHSYQWSNIFVGFRLILWGAFKKLVIADRLSLLIDGVYSNLDAFSGNTLLFSFLLQPLHIYCDFSGYTDIALGIGLAFGFKLTNNFNRPFFATSITMFWKRWHISLTAWCNEFIFRRVILKRRKWGIWASAYAVFLTFIVIGIWHGPSWNFVILGLLQAIAINYEFFTKKLRHRIIGKLPVKVTSFSSYLLVYLFFCVSLVFFNAPEFSDATYIFSNILLNIDFTKLSLEFLSRIDKLILLLSITILFLIEFRQEQGKDIFIEINYWPSWIRTTCYYILCIIVIYFGSPIKEFVYMQF